MEENEGKEPAKNWREDTRSGSGRYDPRIAEVAKELDAKRAMRINKQKALEISSQVHAELQRKLDLKTSEKLKEITNSIILMARDFEKYLNE